MKRLIAIIMLCVAAWPLLAKDTTLVNDKPWKIPALQWNISKDGSRYIRVNATLQVWNRWNQNNPGTLIENKVQANSFDIGIRRLRLQAVAQPLPWMLLYVQFGINNFNAISPRKVGAFFHDAVVEFTPVKKHLSIGSGLTGWTGSARFSSPSVASIMMYDAPLYEQSTNDITDQFLRKLSIYAKGKVARFDYRFVLSDPLSITTSALFDTAYATIGENAKFKPYGKALQTSGYVSYSFLDEESNLLPYTTGTYLGSKKVVNIGAGYEFQSKAVWYLQQQDTVVKPFWQASADVFVDLPLNRKKDDCLSLYGVYSYYDFGKGYIRNLGVMNISNKVKSTSATFNGAGNAYPIVGTGHTIFMQAGYMLPRHWFGTKGFSVMPYAGAQLSHWDRLNDWMGTADAGLQLLLVNHQAKISINYQNRPVFDTNTLQQQSRKSAVIIQWQIAL